MIGGEGQYGKKLFAILVADCELVMHFMLKYLNFFFIKIKADCRTLACNVCNDCVALKKKVCNWSFMVHMSQISVC